MTKRLSPGIIVVSVVIIAIAGFVYFLYRSEKNMYLKGNITDTARHLPSTERYTHVDSLPHYRFMRIQDSLDQIAKIKKDKNTIYPWGIMAGLSTVSFAGFMPGFKTWYEKDKSHLEVYYFFVLNGYIPNDTTEIKQINEKSYMTEERFQNKLSSTVWLPETKSILFPISNSVYKTGMICMIIIFIVASIALLYIFIGLPINVLVSISTGKVFTEVNIRSLYIMSYTLLGLLTFNLLMPHIAWLASFRRLPAGFYLPTIAMILDSWKMTLSVIAMFLIAKAFKKGLALQQEQELTI